MALKQIEKFTKSKIKRKEIPSIDDIFQAKHKNILEKIKNTINEDNHKQYIALATELDEDFNLVDVAAALIKMMFDKELSFDYNQNVLESSSSNHSTVRLFMSIGRMDKITPKILAEFLSDTSDIDKNEVGDIDILEKFSFVNLPERCVDVVLKKSSGNRLNGRRVNIEIASSKR